MQLREAEGRRKAVYKLFLGPRLETYHILHTNDVYVDCIYIPVCILYYQSIQESFHISLYFIPK
jgi:hypothetical protein